MGIELHKRHGSRRGVEFHNVRSVFPKNLESLRWWISRSCGGKAKSEESGSPVVYLSKERLRAISHARGTICPAGRIARSLGAKVVKDFDNPIGEAGGFYITVEGNTSEAGSREGDGVYRKRRAKRTIYKASRWVYTR